MQLVHSQHACRSGTPDMLAASLCTPHRQANAAMVAAARRNKATGPDKKHAMWVAFNVAVS